MTDLLKNYSCEKPTDSSPVAVQQDDYMLQNNASARSHRRSESLYSICQTSSQGRWKNKGAAGSETRLAASQVGSYLMAWSSLRLQPGVRSHCSMPGVGRERSLFQEKGKGGRGYVQGGQAAGWG